MSLITDIFIFLIFILLILIIYFILKTKNYNTQNIYFEI